jgi:DNA-binding IclR family transcriptional regulator
MALLLDRSEQWTSLYEAETAVNAAARAAGHFVGRMRRYCAQGATFDLEDNELGIRCVAAPVRDATNRIVAAISVSATTPYMPATRMRSLVPVVVRVARQVSGRLGHVA